MNNINTIRLDVNSAKQDVSENRHRLISSAKTETSTESDRNKQQSGNVKYLYGPGFDPSDTRYYRTGLLDEFYNTMSGIEPRFKPGSFVEYYA